MILGFVGGRTNCMWARQGQEVCLEMTRATIKIDGRCSSVVKNLIKILSLNRMGRKVSTCSKEFNRDLEPEQNGTESVQT